MTVSWRCQSINQCGLETKPLLTHEEHQKSKSDFSLCSQEKLLNFTHLNSAHHAFIFIKEFERVMDFYGCLF